MVAVRNGRRGYLLRERYPRIDAQFDMDGVLMKMWNLKIKSCPKCESNKTYAFKTHYGGAGITCDICGYEIFADDPVAAKKQWNAESKRRKILFRKF